MIPKYTDINIGSWKIENRHGEREYTLKIKGTNILIGHAYPVFGDNSKLRIVAHMSNIQGEMIEIPMTDDINTITSNWGKLMEESLFIKLFK